jgi:hypothetical protein
MLGKFSRPWVHVFCFFLSVCVYSLTSVNYQVSHANVCGNAVCTFVREKSCGVRKTEEKTKEKKIGERCGTQRHTRTHSPSLF